MERKSWSRIEYELRNTEELNDRFNFNIIKKKSFQFYNLFLMKKDSKYFDKILNLLEARRILDDCIVLTRNNFEPEKYRNPYLSDMSKDEFFKALTTYIGIANARLDIIQQELEKADKFIDSAKQSIEPFKLEVFKNMLLEYMENLVLNPYVNAYWKYSRFSPQADDNGSIPVKDINLFFYFLFLEFFHASEIIGALARQVTFAGKTSQLKAFEPPVIKSFLPDYPENLRTIPIQQNQNILEDDIDSYLKDSVDEEYGII